MSIPSMKLLADRLYPVREGSKGLSSNSVCTLIEEALRQEVDERRNEIVRDALDERIDDLIRRQLAIQGEAIGRIIGERVREKFEELRPKPPIYQINQEELDFLHGTIALLSSMADGGEQHSDTSRRRVTAAIKTIKIITEKRT